MKRQASGVSDAASTTSSKRVMMTPMGVLKHQNRELHTTVVRTKTELAEVKQRLAQMEAERDLFDATSSVIDRAWKLLDSDLLSVAKSIGVSDLTIPTAPRVEAETNGTIPNSSRVVISLAESADSYAFADVTKLDTEEEEEEEPVRQADVTHIDLEATLKQRVSWTTNLLARLIEVIAKGEVQQNVIDFQVQVHALEARVLYFSSKLNISKSRIRELETELDSVKMDVWRLARRLERQESAEVAPLAVPSNGSSSGSTELLSTKPAEIAPAPKNAQVESELKARLEELTEVATFRQEELEKVRQQLKQALLNASPESGAKRSDGELSRELQKERLMRQEMSRQVDRANATSLFALKKLREAEERIGELESAADAIAKLAESVLGKENSKLKQTVEEMRTQLAQHEAQLEALHSLSISSQETTVTLKAVSEERDDYRRKLEERVGKPEAGNDADGLISEIEELSGALGVARESVSRLQQGLNERDKRVSDLITEKTSLEADIRELREEKNALALRSEKVQAVLKENESYVARIEERLASERAAMQRAEELVRASSDACEKALKEREQFKLEADAERERATKVIALEEELRLSRVKNEEVKWELSKVEEEVRTLKRRLERAKAALEAAAKASSSSSATQKSGLQSIDEERLEAMTLALRCPVYQNLWKDCVITKCAHMFSRRALEDNLAQRNRKCPSCKNTYSKDDILNVYLYQSNDV